MTEMPEGSHAIQNAIGHWNSIKELVTALEDAEGGKPDADARNAIEESALSVEVRTNWYDPYSKDADTKPGEYRILLTWGGPALQLVGELTEHGEPETAKLQHQDWGTGWTDSFPYITDRESVEWGAYQETLLTFARFFYFGE